MVSAKVKEKKIIYDYTRFNYFPSNEIATDPMTVVFFFVFLTHLNIDALYFRLKPLF